MAKTLKVLQKNLCVTQCYASGNRKRPGQGGYLNFTTVHYSCSHANEELPKRSDQMNDGAGESLKIPAYATQKQACFAGGG